jgi:hypothetical protein
MIDQVVGEDDESAAGVVRPRGSTLGPSQTTQQIRIGPLAKEMQWQGSFTFVQAADTQLGFMGDETWGGRDGDCWDDEIDLVKRLVRCVNAMTPLPRFVAVCGDLVHSLPDGLTMPDETGPHGAAGLPSVARYTNEDRWRRQNADFKEAMSDLSVPLVCVCGNHDVGDRPTQTSLDKYRSLYGPDHFSFWCGGVKALVINAQLMNDPADAPEAHEAQETWLAGELDTQTQAAGIHSQTEAGRLCNQTEAHGLGSREPGSSGEPLAQHSIAFQHIPWFLRTQGEPRQGYFNLAPETRARWLGRLADAGVSKVFCGHYHRNSGGYTDDGRLEVVVTSAVGRQMSQAEVDANEPLMDIPSDTKHGMRVVSVGAEGITHCYEEFEHLEKKLHASNHVPAS